MQPSPLTRSQYITLLLLPLLIPTALLGMGAVVTSLHTMAAPLPVPGKVLFIFAFGIGAVFVGQLYMGGIQYLLFLPLILWWARNKSEQQWRAASWRLPLFFALFSLVCNVAFVTMQMRFTPDMMLANYATLMTAAGFAFLAIPFGYFYVFLAHAIVKKLESRRLHYGN